MAKTKTTKAPKKEKAKTSKKEFIPAEDGLTYIERVDIKREQIKQDKLSKQPKLDSKAEDFANDLDKLLNGSIKNITSQTISERGDIPYWINTNCYALNWIISNDFFKGLPGTRTIMVAGKSGKGKSLILDSFLGENIKEGGVSYKLEVEDAGTEKFTTKIMGGLAEIAKRIRVITPKDVTSKTASKDQAITIEKCNTILNRMIDFQASKGKEKQKSIVVGIDSVTQLTSVKELEGNIKEKSTKDMTSAQKMRELFRVITPRQRVTNLTIIGLAQMTANIGEMFGPKEVENAKGTGFAYNSSLSLQATKDKEILASVKGGASIPIGVKMRFKTTKNRIEFKGRDAWLYFYFNSGIDKWGGLIELLAQFGVFTPSAKPNKSGEYEITNTFFWMHPDTGEEFEFKLSTFSKFMEEREDKDDILKIWNYQINEVYDQITADWDESILLESNYPEDEEENISDSEEEEFFEEEE